MAKPPTPLKLRQLRGNPQKRAMPLVPEPEPGCPDRPEHLDEIGRAEWQRITDLLVPIGVVTLADRAVVAGYCQAYSDWVHASERVARARAEDPDEHHWRMEAAQKSAAETMRRFAAELGLTPVARARIRMPGQQAKAEGKARFFEGGTA